MCPELLQPPATNQPTKPLLMSLNERNVEKTGGSGLISTRKVKIQVFDGFWWVSHVFTWFLLLQDSGWRLGRPL